LALEDSLALWERGEQLAAVCEQHLAGARQRIESAIAAREQHNTESPPAVSIDDRPESVTDQPKSPNSGVPIAVRPVLGSDRTCR
ncbi:MAG: exodeoxyribonuclease VII small subunit, partial [Pseudonocardiales bacterium]